MEKVFFVFEGFIIAIFICFICWFFQEKHERDDIDETISELLVQQGKYIRCLDSTAKYIQTKYGECLYDTLWEGDIYATIYEGAEDAECWM